MRYSQKQIYSEIKHLAKKLKEEGIAVLNEDGIEINRIKM